MTFLYTFLRALKTSCMTVYTAILHTGTRGKSETSNELEKYLINFLDTM